MTVSNRVFDDRTISANDLQYQLEPLALALLARVPTTHERRQFIEYLLHYAQMLRADAGYGGSHHDGGAHEFENQVDIFISARIENKLPSQWHTVHDMFQRQNDPEYAEFLRLKKKFTK